MSEHITYYEEKLEDPIVLDKGIKQGFQYKILNIGTHPCAYVGIDIEHPLAGHDYDNIAVNVHGGLTYSEKGDGQYLPKGYWWYGWDYAHHGDYVGYRKKYGWDEDDKKWTLEELQKHVKDAIFQFSQLSDLAEQIHNRAKEHTKQLLNDAK